MARQRFLVLAGAVSCALLTVAVWGLAFHVQRAQRLDARGLHALRQADPGWSGPFAERVAALANPIPFAILCLLVVAVATARLGIRNALILFGVLVVANVLTQELKEALAAPRDLYGSAGDRVANASWPSGHATASMSLALCALIVLPRWPVALLGLAFTAGVSWSVVRLGWHFPSDVAGGYLVAAGAACAGVSVLGRPRAPTAALRRRWPRATG
jgi:membrane-associated phospholipid phosphatase